MAVTAAIVERDIITEVIMEDIRMVTTAGTAEEVDDGHSRNKDEVTVTSVG